jgi:site-specific DNA recombinase
VASTINGNKTRHHGILLNELYAGVLVWNRVRMLKDPDTGKRISRPNPLEEWKRVGVPELAIVDRKLFDAAQIVKRERGHEAPQRQRKPRYLLSSLLKCGCCGGGVSVKDRDHGRVRVHCSTMRESGCCDNHRVFYMDEIEHAVLTGLKEHLKAPKLLKEFAEAYQRERERLSADKHRLRTGLEAKLAETKRLLDRAWQDYESERLPTEVVGARMRELLARQKQLEAELAVAPEVEKVVGPHPAALRQYERCVDNLELVFSNGISADTEEAAAKIRALIARVVIMPDEKGFRLQLEGRLSALMAAPNLYPNIRIAASGGSVVAEEGLEPPTRGL